MEGACEPPNAKAASLQILIANCCGSDMPSHLLALYDGLDSGAGAGQTVGFMNLEKAKILDHRRYSGDYHMLTLLMPNVAKAVKPGQFIHLLIPRLDASVLRRPFSVFRAENDTISILYKEVGRGTSAMVMLSTRDELSIIGPLGNGFPVCPAGRYPVLVAGGYGVAPLLFLATRTAGKGIVLIGAAREKDVLMREELAALGWDVAISTEDGSVGTKGLVTDLLRERIKGLPAGLEPELYVCGPDGMLKAVGEMAVAGGWKAWLSLDRHMGCGVGACLACVQRIRNEKGEESWKRVCKDGPVFEARDVVWGKTGWDQ